MKQRAPIIITLIFCAIYFSISFINHLLYRTAALDLGLYTNALYDYSRFRFNDSTTFKLLPENLLSDHFDLMLIIISPLSFVFHSYTLLICQLAAVLAGGWGVYMFLKAKNFSVNTCVAGMTLFYFQFSVFSALSFDFHSKVIGASLIPWFFYFIEKNRISRALLIYFLVIICQESMPLWMIFVTAGIAVTSSNSKNRKTLLALSAFSLFYFLAVTLYIMPGLSSNGTFYQFKYSILGKNYTEAIGTTFTEPGKIIHALFFNTSGDPMGDYVKSESWFFFLLSGGLFLILRPVWLFMLIPVFLLKFLNDQVQVWGVNGQYSIEFAPLITLGSIDAITRFSIGKWKNVLSVLLIISAASVTIRLMDRTTSLLPKSQIRIYQGGHWRSEVSRESVKKAFSFIPGDAIISSHSNLLPHLALRDKCYSFPIIKDASFIIFIERGASYPLSRNDYDKLADSLVNDKIWKTIFSENKIVVLKRNKE